MSFFSYKRSIELNVITLDGPAGSGKTACGRLAALALGIDFLSSGLYFRALTFNLLSDAVALSDTEAVAAGAGGLDVVFENRPDALKVLVDGEEKTDALKMPEVTSQIHFVAENEKVRSVLAEKMRALAARRPLLAEGRDMGSVVFPDAACKLFITADAATRAERRARELEQLGQTVDRKALEEEITRRDERDRRRRIAPLVVPEGAEIIDSSSLAIDEAVQAIVDTVRRKVTINEGE